MKYTLQLYCVAFIRRVRRYEILDRALQIVEGIEFAVFGSVLRSDFRPDSDIDVNSSKLKRLGSPQSFFI
jgi:predicted nucleotidyltransferase